MNGDFVRVPSSDGDAFDACLCLPAGGRGPGVVMIPEIFGVNEGLRRCAELFAGAGYAVAAPDIFWRLERNVELDYGEAGYKKAFALHAAFDYEQGMADMNDAIEWLRGQPFCTGKVCATGFCLGGTMAYLAAARAAGHSRYNEPPLYRDEAEIVTYPGERNLFRIHRLDRQQPQLPADNTAAERISEANFLALTAAVREQLPAGAGIIIPPYLRYFRDALVDYRIFLQEHHDGNLMMGSPAFLGFWQARMLALMGLDYEYLPSKVSGLNFTVMRRAYLAIDSAHAAALAITYPEYRYFVTERGHRLDFAVIAGNDGFLVYDLLQPGHTGAAID